MAVGKIQRVPRGLLQYLGMVGSGRSPVDMADEVRGVFDLTPFYSRDLLTGVSQGDNVQNVGDTVVLPVPAGKAWLVICVQAGMTTAIAGELIAPSARIRIGNNQIRFASWTKMTASAAAAQLSFGTYLPRPLLLTAGNELQLHCDDILAAAPRNGTIGGIVAEFDI